ncbi:type II toxin-antitoxin system RelE/ParE family toxin [Paludisphaera mucosa]|uniref:Type II toxin-antitoxin system RelE/ParE family toxin n=1 Tax=Paludisphaera mucosa TaxID=3030827 RepID=A0ABT6F4T6_9BACT|nr:type II toxin-antitoxin system RelE/ParE family toxin [Paludisphaera mucosa]MDG3002534.1 type II toxin-antitoxin system RelE/ParE family toxin [Paludisphaera mucosa]
MNWCGTSSNAVGNATSCASAVPRRWAKPSSRERRRPTWTRPGTTYGSGTRRPPIGFIDRFVSAARTHAQFPLIIQIREDLAPALRCFAVRPYVAFYRVEADSIVVLRLIHGRRDARKLFGHDQGPA